MMIPSHYECPDDWHKEYSGYIMAGHYNHDGGTVYDCIDETLEQIKGSGAAEVAHELFSAYASGSYVPYDSNYTMSCVVCTR